VRRSTGSLLVCLGVLALLVVAGPTLAELATAAVPLVIAVGGVAVVLRLLWYFTGRY
jgi:hypothetical protein